MKPSTKVAMDPILSSIFLDWKKILKLSRESMNMGMKMVAIAFPGYL